MNTIVIGLQHGDEGKGKICNYLMRYHDICVRYSGGPNTGATVQIEDQIFKFHHLPVSLLDNKPAYIASACLIDPRLIEIEIKDLEKDGIDVDSLLSISPAVHIISETHVKEDIRNEKGSNKVGSTKKGISPCSSSKAKRRGVQAKSIPLLKRYIKNISKQLNLDIKEKKSVLFEGTQGTMLDINHGDYPNISTTSNVAGAACSSAGVGPTKIDKVIGVFKPYLTKVGTGFFPTKIDNSTIIKYLVTKGNEFGTTTGRQRAVGWLNLDELKDAIEINGCTDLALVKIDILTNYEWFIFQQGTLIKIKAQSLEDNIKYISDLILKEAKVPVSLISFSPEKNKVIDNLKVF